MFLPTKLHKIAKFLLKYRKSVESAIKLRYKSWWPKIQIISCEASLGERFKFIRSNDDAVPDDVTKKLHSLALEIYEGDAYNNERNKYEGSIGNFFGEKLVNIAVM